MKNLLVVLLVNLLGAGSANAILVTPTDSIRADFTLTPSSLFNLPAVILDETVNFARSNGLNLGEGYEISVFDSNDQLLGTDSYTNTNFANIIGCGCTGGPLDIPLSAFTGYLTLKSLSGTFDVTAIYLVAYDDKFKGAYSTIDTFTLIDNSTSSTIPTPPSFILMVTGLGLLGLTKQLRKEAKVAVA